MTENDRRLDHLHHLVEINKNSEEAFLDAAKEVKNSELESHFTDYSRQHARFAAELAGEIGKLGGHATEEGAAPSAMHRGWTNLKSALTGNSVGVILSSCESAENSALAAYEKAEADIGSGQVFTLLEKHREQITGFHKRLERLVGEIKDGVEFPDNE